MKKMVVINDKTDSVKENLVAEFFSIQFNYGLYDFDPEKIVRDLEELYGVSLVSLEHPSYMFEDGVGGTICAEIVEEYE